MSLPVPVNGTTDFVLTRTLRGGGKDDIGTFFLDLDFFTDSVMQEFIDSGTTTGKTNITANQAIVVRLIRTYVGDQLNKEELKAAARRRFGKSDGSLENDPDSLIWVYPEPSWSLSRLIFGHSCQPAQAILDIISVSEKSFPKTFLEEFAAGGVMWFYQCHFDKMGHRSFISDLTVA